MNSDKIKARLTYVVERAALDYILALEAERDAWRRVDSEARDQTQCPDLALRAHYRSQARACAARVDSFKPPAAPGEGEKA